MTDDRDHWPDPQAARRRAVALRYREDEADAPRVLARGQGPVAERIIALARSHGIPLHEDGDLVRLLGILDLDAEIPPTMYRALAEVLAHVYRANRNGGLAARGNREAR